MSTDSRAGTRATAADLVDVEKLLSRPTTTSHPDPSDPLQARRVRHVRATAARRCRRPSTTTTSPPPPRRSSSTAPARARTGRCSSARDTHALSGPAWETCVEVLAANDVAVLVDAAGGYTPTPAVSHAILAHNRSRAAGIADGIVITPSHNPPQDGGFKYNPPNGGPADTDATKWIADAGERAARGEAGRGAATRRSTARELRHVRLPRPLRRRPARGGRTSTRSASAGVRIGADPLGGASVAYWGAIAERHGIDLTVVNPVVDPQFGFMTLDWDGKIRMDCSSPYAMASLVARRGEYQIATGNDADADRHGIVTADGGLMNPNHYLAVAIGYLYANRPGWPGDAGIGKTAVSSSMIDFVAARPRQAAGGDARRVQVVRAGPDRRVDRVRRRGERGCVVPAHGRHGVDHRQGRDHPLPARLGDPRGHRADARASATAELTARFGEPVYARIDVACSKDDKAKLGKLAAKRRHGDRARRRSDHPAAHRGPRQRCADRRAEGRDRGRLVRGAARPAPKTSTRSMPRASRARSTWRGSRRRRETSSPQRSTADPPLGRPAHRQK